MPDELDERTLVDAARADPARFLDLYDRHFHRIYAYVARRVASRADAEDVTSEVFHRALANLETYEWRGVPFAAWLFRIAANALADRRRQAARDAGHPVPGVEGHDPELERRVLPFQLVGRLPADQRRVIEMRFGSDKSLLEVRHRGCLGERVAHRHAPPTPEP